MIFSKKLRVICLCILFLSFPLTLFYLSARKGKDIEDNKDKVFANQELLNPIFEKLYNLEKNKKGKINIVHIGDSHIQADFFTDAIRGELQDRFGNGGYGFTFPYSLVKTNGTRNVKYSSNATWQSLRNVSPIADVGVGLSGIALYTSSSDFILQLYTEDGYEFNNVKVIYPDEKPHYKMSITAEPLEVTGGATASSTPTTIRHHKVKSGETLFSISRRYGVTPLQVKKVNAMKSNIVKRNQTLKIPSKTVSKAVTNKVKESNLDKEELEFVEMVSKPYYSSYTSDSAINRITLMPDGDIAMYTLNGFVIENSNPGVVYHTIGVNGAQIRDYTKYPLFFKQLPILNPDLIILSFGTNESFGKMSDSQYIFQLNEFVNNIKSNCKNATILVMTPPPSMFRKGKQNTFVADYSMALMGINYLPVWDLYSRMNGDSSIRSKGEYASKIARDKVHYTVDGYEIQGQLFASDFMEAYNNYKRQKQ